jgi:hypothetical protein
MPGSAPLTEAAGPGASLGESTDPSPRVKSGAALGGGAAGDGIPTDSVPGVSLGRSSEFGSIGDASSRDIMIF